MTISDDDEREARKWLNDAVAHPTPLHIEKKHRATILALLDRVMPRPEDVSVTLMQNEIQRQTGMLVSAPVLTDAYRVLYDHVNAPKKPKPVEVWAVVKNNGDFTVWANREQAQNDLSEGTRIVRLVEASDDQ